MDNIFRFRRFPVYKDARKLRKELKEYIRDCFPEEEKYCLTSQIFRALDSIILNIAEGSERYSDVDFSRFLNNALTSLNEVVAGLDAALDDGYINIEKRNYFSDMSKGIYKQLRAFSAKVRSNGA